MRSLSAVILSSLILVGCLPSGGGMTAIGGATAVSPAGQYDGTYTLTRLDCYTSTNGLPIQNATTFSGTETSQIVVSGSSFTRSYNGACTLTEAATVSFSGSSYSLTSRGYTSSNGATCNFQYNLNNSGSYNNPALTVSGSNSSTLLDLNSNVVLSSTEIALRWHNQFHTANTLGWCFLVYSK